jgi:hypothetical protein
MILSKISEDVEKSDDFSHTFPAAWFTIYYYFLG